MSNQPAATMSNKEEPKWSRWTVKSGPIGYSRKTGLPTERTHRLLYLGKEQNSAKGVTGLRAMQAQAEFLNKHKLPPKRPVECLADLNPGERARWSATNPGTLTKESS